MTYRQSIWGYSNGIVVFALSAFFWLSLGLGMGVRLVAPARSRTLVPILAVVNLAVFLGLLVSAIHLRRKARGFRLSEARTGDAATQRETAEIIRGLRWIYLFEAAAVALVGVLCAVYTRSAWPWIGLAIGLHFIPLASVLRVPFYVITGLVGMAVSVSALLMETGPVQSVVLGYGMGTSAAITAVYLALTAERVAQRFSGAPIEVRTNVARS
jgi:hypothetical protein